MMKRVLVPLDEPAATDDIIPIVGMLATAGAAVHGDVDHVARTGVLMYRAPSDS